MHSDWALIFLYIADTVLYLPSYIEEVSMWIKIYTQTCY